MALEGNNPHSTESQLIVACSRTRLDAGHRESISRLLDKAIDWDDVIRIAARNAVLPLMAKTLLADFDERLSTKVKQILVETRREILHRNVFMTNRLLSILKLLEANDIPVLPFKGPLLSIQAYGDLGLRYYVDLDILVPFKNLRGAFALLEAESYLPLEGRNFPGNLALWLGKKKDIYLRSRDGLTNVELHWKLSGSHFDIQFDRDELWSRLDSVEIAGQQTRTLGFEDLLIYLCLHGSRHGWEKFGWICDVHELITTKADIDWTGIAARAKRVGCEKTMQLGLFLVRRYFGERAVPSTDSTVEPNEVYESLAIQIHRRLFDTTLLLMRQRERYLYHLALKRRPWDRIKLHSEYVGSLVRDAFKRL